MARTLLRVEKVTLTEMFFVLPAWNHEKTLKIKLTSLPKNIQESLKTTKYLHVKINYHAKKQEDLNFTDWEPK